MLTLPLVRSLREQSPKNPVMLRYMPSWIVCYLHGVICHLSRMSATEVWSSSFHESRSKSIHPACPVPLHAAGLLS